MFAGDADAFLGIDSAGVRTAALTEEHVLELVHTGIGEQQRRIVRRYKRRRAHECMPSLAEEVDEFGADVFGVEQMYMPRCVVKK